MYFNKYDDKTDYSLILKRMEQSKPLKITPIRKWQFQLLIIYAAFIIGIIFLFIIREKISNKFSSHSFSMFWKILCIYNLI